MSKKLLLADDSITIQKVIGITFVNEDYQLTVVDNGDAAFEKAQAERPDLILADVFMPGKNGYELCAALKQEPALANVPVLLLAGTFEPFDEDKARSCGADSWIAKPFESQTLIDRVEELLARAPEAAPAALQAQAPPITASSAPEAAAEPAPADLEADLWADVESPAEAAAPVEAAAAAEDLADDDIWGAVSFDEDDLLEGSAGSSANEQKVWGDVGEAAVLEDEHLAEAFDVPVAEDVPEAVAQGGAQEEEDLFVFEDDSIEDLGDEDILEVVDEADDFIIEEEEPQELTEAGSAEVEGFEDDTEILALDDDDILPLDDDDIIIEEELVDDQVAVAEAPPVEDLTPEPAPAAAAAQDTQLEEDLEPVEGLAAAFEEPAGLAEVEILEEAPVVEEQAGMEEPLPGGDEIAFDEPIAVGEDVAAAASVAVEQEVAVAEPAAVEQEIAFEEAVAPAGQVAANQPASVEEGDFPAEQQAEFAPAEEPAAARPFEAVPAATAAALGGAAGTMAEPSASAPVASVAEVEARAAALSEEQLAEVVERVAGTVIERLANTILEKIAWEVVPDLAESLIQEEIRKIKEQVE